MQIRKFALVLMLVTLALVGFAPQPQAVSLKIATATAGGVWNPMGIALGNLIGKHVPGVTATALVTGGAVENLKLLATGKVDLAFAYDYHVAWLNTGKLSGVVEGKPPARILLGLYEHPLHVITRQGTGINSLTDLKGKRVSTGAVDSGAEEQAGFVLKALGLDWDKDLLREKLGVTESAAALKEGKLDAFFWSGAVPSEAAPTAAINDLATDPKIKMVLLPIKGTMAETITQANPAVFHRALIKKGEYPGLDADVETLAVTAVLTSMDTFPASQLTSILTAVFDYKSELVSAWNGAATLTAEKSVGVLAPETVQYLHPAAAAVFQNRETLYQVSTMASLKAGHYDGFETVGGLKQKGNLGIGTFEGLDGEMVVLDGQVYQVKDTGAAAPAADSVKTPFAMVTVFDPDVSQDLGALPNVAALQTALEKLITHKDMFYAIRVDGTFKTLQVRAVAKQKKPYPELTAAIKTQVVFDYQNIKGTIVCFWSPDYLGGINDPGYHLHFISDDHTKGGHLLEGALTSARAQLDETRYFEMKLNPAGD
jgi:alpha-acetolactate decarboxylase